MALGAAAREALRLADLLQELIADANEAIKKGDKNLAVRPGAAMS